MLSYTFASPQVLATQTVNLGLWGTDPDLNAIKNRISSFRDSNGNPAPWWAQRYFQEETSYHQFNSAPGITGTPNFGPACGFGLSQLDPPGNIGHTTAAAIQDVWNWQANLTDGLKLMGAKIVRGNNLWKATTQAYQDAVDGYSRDPAHNQQPAPPPCNVIIGNGFVFSFYPTAGQHSFAEANGIKCMGQCNNGYLNYTTADGWWWSTFVYFQGGTFNVVQRILSQSVQ